MFSNQIAKMIGQLRGTDAYIMGDLNVDLLKASTHGPTSDYLGEFKSAGFYPLVSLPTRLTNKMATLIDNIWTNNIEANIGSCGPRDSESLRLSPGVCVCGWV